MGKYNFFYFLKSCIANTSATFFPNVKMKGCSGNFMVENVEYGEQIMHIFMLSVNKPEVV